MFASIKIINLRKWRNGPNIGRFHFARSNLRRIVEITCENWMPLMANIDAAERVRRRLLEWKEGVGHGAGIKLAEAVQGKFGDKRSAQWASGVFRGETDLRLKDLDAVAELLGVPPGDLVRRDNDHYLEVIPSEMQFIRHLRRLPDTVRHNILHVWDYMFGFQDRLLKEYKDQVDKRTKIARAERERQKRTHTRKPA